MLMALVVCAPTWQIGNFCTHSTELTLAFWGLLRTVCKQNATLRTGNQSDT